MQKLLLLREAGIGPCVNSLSSEGKVRPMEDARPAAATSPVAFSTPHLTWIIWGLEFFGGFWFFFFSDESPSFTFCKQFLAESLEEKLCPWWKHPANWEGRAPAWGSASFSSQAAPAGRQAARGQQK